MTYAFVFAAILFGGMIEFYSFFNSGKYSPNKSTGYFIGLVLFVLTFLVSAGYLNNEWYLALLPLILMIFASEMYRKKDSPIENVAITVFPILYIALPISIINLLVFPEGKEILFQPNVFIAVLVIIWIYDSGAYIFGVSFGKHRLFERISPKKSWEGAIGGTIVAIVSSYFIQLFVPEIGLVHWMVLSLLIAISATFGDLTESLIKRTVGVKDSGNFFPGHGGFLDRFDSLLFVVPVVVLYLKIIS